MNAVATIDKGGAKPAVFSFGDPEGVLDRRDLSMYFEVWHNGTYYEPPLPMNRLAQMFNVSPYHRSAVGMKVNKLVAQMVPSRWFSAADFERFALDFVQMGNAYLEGVPNNAQRLAMAAHTPAVHMRAGVKPGVYWFINGPAKDWHEFDPGRIFHLQQPDVAQEIYGLPEWLAAMQSALLSESATLFRRRYYLNGAHAGFILHVSDTLVDQKTADLISEKLQAAKGVGNFKNLFIYTPKGKKDGVQILPIADVTAKDEFSGIKNISRDDMLAGHRTPPQMIGVIPQNSGGFGSPREVTDIYFETEIVPLQVRMLRANDWFGVKLLSFRDYVCGDGTVIREDGTKVMKGAPR